MTNMGLWDYLKSWDNPTSPKGSEETGGDGGDYRYGVPYSAPMPETKEWGDYGPNDGGYGHSDDVVEKNDYKAWPGIDRDDVAQGYTKPGDDAGEPGSASYPQSIPQTNEWDRQEAYARAHNDTGVHDGEGHDISTPGKQQIGSRENLG